LLAKPTPLNINFDSNRFAMFNKHAGYPAVKTERGFHWLKTQTQGQAGLP